MTAKFVLIALVCIAVAQVHGGELEDAINRALRKAEILYEKGEKSFEQAFNESNFKAHLVDHNTYALVERSKEGQESARAAIRKVADLIEKKAIKANSPESVFECIRTNEDGANAEIETYVKRFGMGMNNLRGMAVTNIFTTAAAYEKMADELNLKYDQTVMDINKCQNVGCVNNLLGKFSSSVNSALASINRVAGQIGGFFASFENDSSKYIETNTQQLRSIKSIAIKKIKACFYGQNKEVFDIETEESEE